MKTVFKLKDLVKYIVFIGVVYALFKLIPSQPFNQRDLILIVSVISFGFIFIDCYSRTEGFATMEEDNKIATPLATTSFKDVDPTSITNDPVDQESDAGEQESDDVEEQSDAVEEESDGVAQESEGGAQESETNNVVMKSEMQPKVESKSEKMQPKVESKSEKMQPKVESKSEKMQPKVESKPMQAIQPKVESKPMQAIQPRVESKQMQAIQPRVESKPMQKTVMVQNETDSENESNNSDIQSVVSNNTESETASEKVNLNVNSKYDNLRQEYYNEYNNPKQEKTTMNKYQNVLNKTNSTNNINPKVTAVISNKSEQKRFQEVKNIAAANGNTQSTGCGVEMEKLKREISQHIGELEDKIKSLENQPINENMEKYKNYLMKDLAQVGILDQIDIENLNSKLDNHIMTIEEAISKLENLKLHSKPKAKLNKAKKESDYNELPSDFYDPLGDPQLSKWDTAFHMLNTNKWQVPMPRPPVCINTSPCKVCPEVDSTGSNSLRLTDWDNSRKVMNLTVNKDWANDQMDVNTSVPLNVNRKKEKKVYQYDDMVHSREEAKQHPPLKTGGLIPYNSNKIDKSNLPSLNNQHRKVTSKNKKTAQVQSFRNVDDSNEYVTRYRSRFD